MSVSAYCAGNRLWYSTPLVSVPSTSLSRSSSVTLRTFPAARRCSNVARSSVLRPEPLVTTRVTTNAEMTARTMPRIRRRRRGVTGTGSARQSERPGYPGHPAQDLRRPIAGPESPGGQRRLCPRSPPADHRTRVARRPAAALPKISAGRSPDQSRQAASGGSAQDLRRPITGPESPGGQRRYSRATGLRSRCTRRCRGGSGSARRRRARSPRRTRAGWGIRRT